MLRPKTLDDSWDLINFPSGSNAQTGRRTVVLRTDVIKPCLSRGSVARNVSICRRGLSPRRGGNENWETGSRNTVEKGSPGRAVNDSDGEKVGRTMHPEEPPGGGGRGGGGPGFGGKVIVRVHAEEGAREAGGEEAWACEGGVVQFEVTCTLPGGVYRRGS